MGCKFQRRPTHESSLSESGLAQVWLMKIRVESNRAREIFQTKKSSSSSVRYYSS
jgi:hypothetical protein